MIDFRTKVKGKRAKNTFLVILSIRRRRLPQFSPLTFASFSVILSGQRGIHPGAENFNELPVCNCKIRKYLAGIVVWENVDLKVKIVLYIIM